MTVPRIAICSFAHPHAHSYAEALVAFPILGEAPPAPNNGGARIVPTPRSGSTMQRHVAVTDDNQQRGREAAAQHGVPYFAPNDMAAQGLTGVIVCAENARHREWTERALHAGVKHVLCEKPLAATAEDAQAMMETCADAGATLHTAFPCRYAPAFARALALVRDGKIGDVLAVRGTNRGTMPGGWFVDAALSGGGAVIDHTVHVADLNRLLLGQEADTVYAEIGSGFYKQAWDDTGFLSIHYDGGAFATLDTSWSRPKGFPTWGDVTLQIVGTAGVLDVDLFAQHASLYDKNGARWPFWGSDMDALMVADFVTLCAGGDAPHLATGTDGLRALEVALAAYASARASQPVRVEGLDGNRH